MNIKKNVMRQVSKGEREKMDRLAEALVKSRGEVIHWMTEIESILDEIIIDYFIKDGKKSAFYEIILWEDFRLSTKIRLLEEIKIIGEEDVKKKLAKEIKKLSSIRNKFAHRLSLITMDKVGLIDKKHKLYEFNDKGHEEFKDRAIDTLARLKLILLKQKGFTDFSISKKSYWTRLRDIKSPKNKNSEK